MCYILNNKSYKYSIFCDRKTNFTLGVVTYIIILDIYKKYSFGYNNL